MIYTILLLISADLLASFVCRLMGHAATEEEIEDGTAFAYHLADFLLVAFALGLAIFLLGYVSNQL